MSVRKKWKIQRVLGLELPGLGKPDALEKRNYPPGQHGNARKPKVSQFRAQLREKQKLIFHYGIREEQVRRFVRKAKRLQPRNWIEALVGLLERRAALSPRFKSHPVRLQYEPGCGVLRQTWRVMER